METPSRSIVQEYIGSEDSEEFDFSKDKEETTDATEVKEDENGKLSRERKIENKG
jgi:hypothetical protein